MPDTALRVPPPPPPAHSAATLVEEAARVGAYTDEAFTAVDPSGRMVFANEAAAKLLGFASVPELLAASPAQLMQRYEIASEDGQPFPVDQLPQRLAMQGHKPAPRIVRFRARGTSEDRWSLLRSQPVFDASGNLLGALSFIRDVTESRASERSLEFLSRATAILGDSLDYEMTLSAVSRAAVPDVADWCAVDLAEPDGIHWKRVAVAHVDPEKVALAEALERKYPTPVDSPTGVPNVLRTGTAEIVEEIPPGFLDQLPLADEQRKLLEELQLRSYVVLPLIARGRTLGALTLVFAESGRRFTRPYVKLAESLARAAAVAVDNARLYRDANALSERLTVAMDAGRLGAWHWDIRGNRVHWSPIVERIHGIPEGSFQGTFEEFRARIHPDDLERVQREITATVAEKRRDYDITYRVVRPSGEVRWLEAHARLVLDPHGDPERLVGVCTDATDRITAEETARALAIEQAARGSAEAARAFTQAILESLEDPTYVLDERFNFTFANRAARDRFGRGIEVRGKNLFEIRPDLEAFKRPKFEEVIRTRQPITFEEEDGGRWYEIRAYPMDSGVTVALRDVSARHRHEALQARLARNVALRADVAHALTVSGTIPEMLQRCTDALVKHLGAAFARVWTLNRETQILELEASSGKYTHLDGAHARVPVGLFKIGLIAKERVPHLTNDVQNDPRVGDRAWAKREGMVSFAGYPLVIGDELLGVMAMFGHQPMADDTLTALAGVADLLAQGLLRKRAQLDLEHHARELARSNEELQQFAYVASHDLQEPLRMVASYTQLLGRRYKGKLDADADDFIRYAVDGVTRMQALINDLLAYSRVGTRGREAQPAPLSKVYADSVSNLQLAIAQSGATVTHDPLPVVLGDAGQLTQLFQNLIGNAIKFRSTEAPKVHVSAARQGAMWRISISDNGIGISPQYFDRVFVIFQRLHTRSEYQGNGIGLAICKKIVERHGGRIWIESEPQKGSTFHFTLPAADAKEVP